MDDDEIDEVVLLAREADRTKQVVLDMLEEKLTEEGATPTPFALLREYVRHLIMFHGQVGAMAPSDPVMRELRMVADFADDLIPRDTDGARA